MPETFQRGVRSNTTGIGPGPLSVYLHLPFCRVKCTYCAFAISTDSSLEDRYVSALIEEMRRRVPAGALLATLYFGGGTPSRLSARSVERLAKELDLRSPIEGAEITLEANPEDVSEETLERWTTLLGVNRISLGVQSFHENELAPLGRLHGRQGALEAIELASRHVPRSSVDLILGLPGQTVESVAASAKLALQGPAGHLSLYLLDLEEGSALEQRVRAGLIDLPGDDETAEMYRTVVRLARQHGLEQYEVSNFALPGQAAVHNRRYWQRTPYLGLGLGAHSFDSANRSSNTRVIGEYLEMIEAGSLPIAFTETLDEDEIRHERIFLGLRQAAGVPASELRQLAGESGEKWLEEALDQKWVTIDDDDRVRFTVNGYLVSDELISALF